MWTHKAVRNAWMISSMGTKALKAVQKIDRDSRKNAKVAENFYPEF
jgi:hypothetical protein